MRFENDRLISDRGDIHRIDGLFKQYGDDPARLLRVVDDVENKLPDEQQQAFRKAWDLAARRHWPRLKSRYFSAWQQAVARMWLVTGSEYALAVGMLARLPAAEEPEWLDWCLADFTRRLTLPDGFHHIPADNWVDCLKRFRCWTGAKARRFIDAIDQRKQPLELDTVGGLLAPQGALEPADRACIALAFLMRERDRFAAAGEKISREQFDILEREKEFIGTLPEGIGILRLFALLNDLPAPHYHHKSLWSELGPDEKATWRAEVVSAADNEALRHGLIEQLIWQTRGERYSNRLYSEIELLVLALCKTGDDLNFVTKLQNHVSRLVCVRAAALLSRLGRGSMAAPLIALPGDGITVAAASQALAITAANELGARTWMQDRAVERAIFGAVQRVERDFCLEYERSWRLEEEMHLATLLAQLQGAFKETNGILDALASQGIGSAPFISFAFRQVTKHEEGGRGIGTDRFSVDVAFLIRVTDAGNEVTKRATFMQCKKLYGNKSGGWHPSFEIDRLQCDELIGQTEASFYLFLTPPFAGNEVWITPARLVRNLTSLQGSSALPRAPAYFASRSLAHWITYDLFGLWTGDERKALVEKTEGLEPGYAPRFIVAVTLHRNPTADEAPNRTR